MLKAPALPRVPFNNLSIQWGEVRDGVMRELDEVFARNAFCLGPHVEAFEAEIGEWLGCRHAIGVNSGTSALHLAAIVAGIGPGDEVLIPAHTFIATAWGVMYAGGKPVFCDVDEATGTIDCADARRRITSRTKAVIPVHLYGQPADMAAVAALAEEHGLTVIEDAAQSIGARWDGRRTGSLSRLGCVSFYPGKNLGAAGEAGLITTGSDEDAARIRALRNHAQSDRYVHGELGYNYRLEGVQAAVLRHKLRRLDAWTDERRSHAARFSRGLAGLPLELPLVAHQDHVWHIYVVRTRERDRLREFLAARNIETGLHYPVPLHRQPAFASYPEARASFPVAERWAREGLSLPLFVGMSDEQATHVIDSVRDFFANV